MKKNLIMLLFLLCIAGTSFAQTSERQDAVGKFRFVPSVMITYNPYSLQDFQNNDATANYKFGVGVGIEAEYRFLEGMGVALGASYLVQGIKMLKKTGGLIQVNNYTMSLDWKNEQEAKLKTIRIPLLICMHPLENDRLTLKAGCQAEFLIGMGDKYKKTSLGAPLAIAYCIDDRLQFDLRYNFGLTDILKDEATNVTRDCVVLSAGIRF
jgi:hypothetical protein